MIRKVLLILGTFLLLLLIWYFPLVSYGGKQGLGQLQIVWSSRPVEEVLNDPAVPDSVKTGLNFVREVVAFGVSEVGLEDQGNYQTYFDQKGRPVLFVVTGAEKYSLTPYEWKFPVIGKVPYKGFFNQGDAEKERERLLKLGLDADIRNPGGWSTLGWFKDPVLSSMLGRSKGDLANTILHELTHGTVFVKDSIEYNENLASFIGYQGAILFLEKKYGTGSKELTHYLYEEEDFNLYVEHILRGADKLDSLYRSMNGMEIGEKELLKTTMIREVFNTMDTINFHFPENFNWKGDVLPGNTYFLSFLRYRSKQDDLEQMLEKDFNNNLEMFVKHLQKKYSYL